MQQLHHKKNEKQEVEFFQDKKCTIPFDFTNEKDLYIELKDGDITPLLQIGLLCNATPYTFRIFTPYIQNKVQRFFVNGNSYQCGYKIKTLDDITLSLSKYIPEDNAVLFLSLEDYDKYRVCLKDNDAKDIAGIYPNPFTLCDAITGEPVNTYKKITIFLHHGTQSELEKANEVAKELKEKYGVEEVNLFILHSFVEEFIIGWLPKVPTFIDKIITTNSTGILKPEDSKERLQVIDCKEMFEEALKENN